MSDLLPSKYKLKTLELTTHEGKTVNIMNLLVRLKFTEDLFTPFIHGMLMISDANDLHQIAPLIGEEIIKITYSTDDTKTAIERVFSVYRIETTNDDFGEFVGHILYFTSVEAFVNENVTISKSYKNKSTNFIIRDAFSYLDSSKKLDVVSTVGSYHIISPNWNPFQLINYVSSISRSKTSSPSLMLFYENAKGFNFQNLDDLIQKESLGLWTSYARAKNKEPNSTNDEIFPSNAIIEHRIIKNSTDVLKSMGEGLYANAVISYDNITKSVRTYKYDYASDFSKTSHLSGFKLNSQNFKYNNLNQRLTYIPSNSHRHNSAAYLNMAGETYSGDKKELIIPYRTSILSQISARQMEIVVNGDTNILVGETMDIELRNVTALESRKFKKHRYNTKKVLIMRVTNEFTPQQHKMILRVNDDSYPDSLESLSEFNEVASNV